MPQISTITADFVRSKIPAWSSLNSAMAYDVFVGAIGFEARSSVIFQRLYEQGSLPRSAILLVYPFNEAENGLQREAFYRIARSAQINVVEVPYNRVDVYGKFKSALDVIGCKTAILDVSSLGSFAFYPLAHCLFDHLGDGSIAFAYTEARDYFPTMAEWQEFSKAAEPCDELAKATLFEKYYFLCQGIESIYESPVFPGANPDSLPGKLVIFPNFSYERVHNTIEYYSSRYSASEADFEWIIGDPPDVAKNGWRRDALASLFRVASSRHDVSTASHIDTWSVLNEIWQKSHESHNMSIATVGSKAQHIGTFLFLVAHKECMVVLSEPKVFKPSRYTSDAGESRMIHIVNAKELVWLLRATNGPVFSW